MSHWHQLMLLLLLLVLVLVLVLLLPLPRLLLLVLLLLLTLSFHRQLMPFLTRAIEAEGGMEVEGEVVAHVVVEAEGTKFLTQRKMILRRKMRVEEEDNAGGRGERDGEAGDTEAEADPLVQMGSM